MASNQSTAALSMVKKLSPFVYFYEPEPSATQQTAVQPGYAPKLVLIASWMDAQDLHIAKYIAKYRILYPTSAILLVRFFFRHCLRESAVAAAVEPALVYLLSKLQSGALSATPAQPEILVHTFSNGGCTTMQTFYQLFRSRTGRAFPLHAAVYDSCPGFYSFSSLYSVFMLSLPKMFRLIAAPFISAFILALWVWHSPLNILAGEDMLSKNGRTLNDLDLVKQTNRSYIYGTADVMVEWKHVEKHAAEAAAHGYLVRREAFEHSPHASHMRTDGGRYWKIVVDTWEKAMKLKAGH